MIAKQSPSTFFSQQLQIQVQVILTAMMFASFPLSLKIQFHELSLFLIILIC